MPKQKRRSGFTARQLALGGQEIPAAVQRRVLIDTGRRLDARAQQVLDPSKSKLRREAQKYRSKLAASPDLENPDVARTAERMRRLVVGISRKPVSAPRAPAAATSILDAGYSLRLAPTYDYGNVSTFPEYDFAGTGFARRTSGEIGVSAVASGSTQALVSARVGSFFIPLFGEGTVRATANPTFSFAWWSNGLGARTVTYGKMTLAITSYRRNADADFRAVATATRQIWWVEDVYELQFDWGSFADNDPMTVTAKVDSDHFYLIGLSVEAIAFLNGSDLVPQQMAGGTLNATLPYIDLEVRLRPNVLEPA